MKGIKEWGKRINTDANFAASYKGVQSVQDIINLAKKQKYDLTTDDLIESVSGGSLIDVSSSSSTLIQVIQSTVTNTGEGSTIYYSPTIIQKANQGNSDNSN